MNDSSIEVDGNGGMLSHTHRLKEEHLIFDNKVLKHLINRFVILKVVGCLCFRF